jgi:hypothetical protein
VQRQNQAAAGNPIVRHEDGAVSIGLQHPRHRRLAQGTVAFRRQGNAPLHLLLAVELYLLHAV